MGTEPPSRCMRDEVAVREDTTPLDARDVHHEAVLRGGPNFGKTQNGLSPETVWVYRTLAQGVHSSLRNNEESVTIPEDIQIRSNGLGNDNLHGTMIGSNREETSMQETKESLAGGWEDQNLCCGSEEADESNEGDGRSMLEAPWTDQSICKEHNGDEQKSARRSKEVRWTEQALCDAMAAVRNGSITAYKASKRYGIPRSTLRNWLNGRNRSRKRGPLVDEAFCQERHMESLETVNRSWRSGSENETSEQAVINVGGQEGHTWKKRRLPLDESFYDSLTKSTTKSEKLHQFLDFQSTPFRYWVPEEGGFGHKEVAGDDVEVQGQAISQGLGEISLLYVTQGLPHSALTSLEAPTAVKHGDNTKMKNTVTNEHLSLKSSDCQDINASKKGRLKKEARDAGRRKVGGWTEKALSEAIEAIKSGSATICKASRNFGIPRTTLRNWITGRTRSRKRGPHSGLPLLPYVGTNAADQSLSPLKTPQEKSGTSLVCEGLNLQLKEDNNKAVDMSENQSPSQDGTQEVGINKGEDKWNRALAEVAALAADESVPVPVPELTVQGDEPKCSGSSVAEDSAYSKHGQDEASVTMELLDVKETREMSSVRKHGWTEQALYSALAAIRSGLSIRKAGQSFGIPRTTLRNWLSGRTQSRKRGPNVGMTKAQQEESIVEWFLNVHQVCHSLMALQSLRHRLASMPLNRSSPFQDGIPMKKWWVWFNKHYPDVASRVADGLRQSQMKDLNEELSLIQLISMEHMQPPSGARPQNSEDVRTNERGLKSEEGKELDLAEVSTAGVEKASCLGEE